MNERIQNFIKAFNKACGDESSLWEANLDRLLKQHDLKYSDVADVVYHDSDQKHGRYYRLAI